ncbi:response regulator transcription factor [Flavimobilis sp. GY10621]|uniref:Response regulator transcription factor n=1 Tax=Flavimobilis rhizosphaerae TaxID=2775421 RepID=A0ABR9DS63_9MICO|nr:response regulator transcription factor [Flavimobilis rhizosphaerae]
MNAVTPPEPSAPAPASSPAPPSADAAPVRVVLADDQPVILHGLAAILAATPGIEVVGTAADGAELVRLVERMSPDVALVDVRMPRVDGIEATRRVTASGAGTRVVILTTFDLDEYVYDALRAGASGFLLKDVTAERLVEAVRLVAEGSMLLGPGVTRRLVKDVAARRAAPRVVPGLDELTPREREVFAAVARGLSNAEIAAEQWVSEPTVKSHVSEILRKTGCRDRVQLVVAAYESGTVTSG